LGTVLWLESASTPDGSFGSLVTGAIVWLVVALAWLVLFDVRLTRKPRPTGRALVAWLVVPALAIGTLTLGNTDLPILARFAASRPAIEALGTNPPDYDANVLAGLYQVCCFERTEYGYRLGVGYGAFTLAGFAYSPDGPPPGPDISTYLEEGHSGYRHLDGPWYIWVLKVW
jgi:hypothetical protein